MFMFFFKEFFPFKRSGTFFLFVFQVNSPPIVTLRSRVAEITPDDLEMASHVPHGLSQPGALE